jgi:hypothetical protein
MLLIDMQFALVLIAALALLPPPSAASGECFRYEPDAVNITGTLARHMFYGAPGFGEDPEHDEKETGFYLELAVPLCTVAEQDDIDRPLTGIRRVQLVLDAAGYARLRPFLGRRVTLRGTLFGAITAHHHTPVLLDVLTPVQVKH